MKRSFDELRNIVSDVWPLALLFAVFAFLSEWFLALPHDPRKFSTAGQIAFLAWPPLFGFAYAMLIGYISVDAKRRGMRDVMWTRLALFIPYCIGAVLYFILRDPLLVLCPKCGTRGRPTFVFCPQCGAQLSRSCPVCRRTADPGWKRCAYCGTELSR